MSKRSIRRSTSQEYMYGDDGVEAREVGVSYRTPRCDTPSPPPRCVGEGLELETFGFNQNNIHSNVH